MGEGGLIKTFAQITLTEVLAIPESLDPRANPARWREGNMVRIDVATDAGGWFTWGYLRLLEIPSGPSDGRITLQLGCWLAWADDPQPEGDRSEVETGIGENSATVAARLLLASGIPAEAIDLGAWDYDLPYALQKEGNGSYVAQAGALAFANHCRQLYQDAAGIVRSSQWSAAPGTSVATVTVGLNEALFEPTPDPVPPVERVVVSGVGYQPSTTPNRYSSSFTVTEPASNFSDSAIGTVGITTTEIFEWGEPDEDHDYYWTRSETRLRQPQAVTWIGSDSTQPATTTTYEEKRYDATTKILYRIESGEIANVRTLVDSTVTAFGTVITQRTITDLEHDAAAETLTRRTETTTVPRIQLTGDTGSTGRFVQETARVLDTRWTEDRPDYWVERTSERVAAKNGSGRQGNIKPTALITQRPQIKPDSRPPATDRWEDPTSLKEQHYSAECTWQHPGGATGRVRTRSLTVDPGFSNGQCFEIATREVQLLEGRRESYLIEVPLSDALLWLPPLSTITVNDGANEWAFKLDATAWEYAGDSARLVAMGICVARVALPEPVGTLLPEFESGLEPGQVAPEEPAPFMPPQELWIPATGYRYGGGFTELEQLAVEIFSGGYRYGGGLVEVEVVTDREHFSGGYRYGGRFVEIAQVGAEAFSGGYRYGGRFVDARVETFSGGYRYGGGLVERNFALELFTGGYRYGGQSIEDRGYEPETETVLAALTGTYDVDRQDAINALISALKTAGVWSTYDVLCIAGLNSTDSLINWKNPGTFNSSLVNAPTFTADRGFAGNGSSSYINTNFNPSTAGGNYSLNSAHLGLYCRTDSNPALARDMGARTAFNNDESILILNESGNAFYALNADGNTTAAASGNSAGYWSSSRTASNTLVLRRNGSSFASSALGTESVPNLSMYVGAVNSGGSPVGYTTRQYTAWSIGGGLTDLQLADEYTAIQAYMTAIGANV